MVDYSVQRTRYDPAATELATAAGAEMNASMDAGDYAERLLFTLTQLSNPQLAERFMAGIRSEIELESLKTYMVAMLNEVGGRIEVTRDHEMLDRPWDIVFRIEEEGKVVSVNLEEPDASD